MSEFSQEIDDLNGETAWLYQATAQDSTDIVESGGGSGNEGQQVLTYQYIMPALLQVFADWKDDWPWVNELDFSDAAYSSHYAVEQALSETIDEAQGVCDEYIAEAQDMQLIIEGLKEFLGI